MNPGRRRWLEALGLHRPELRAWALYDWAFAAMITTVTTAVFPIYFVKVAAAGIPGPAATARLAWVSSAALAVAAALSPLLGALADQAPIKKRGLAACMAVGVAACAGMWWIERGDLTIRRIGDVAIVVGPITNHLKNPDGSSRLQTGTVTQVLRLTDDGAWRFVNFQLTPTGEEIWGKLPSERAADTAAGEGDA